ncbi:hypothetical protein CSAL01_07959 [Colletotrichum salicis]|uniref:Uncharacterized protein n=1 Tax=Colletotrichum salicis TaxID=1209931 RepID=A0A135V2V5_9PEZI|nr:hypothetical protein CSAL01_07959 [Colletotrichum salicis]
MRDKNLKKPAKCVLPYKEQDERQETYELMPLPGPAPDPNLHRFEEVPIKIKSKRVRLIRRLTKQPRSYKRVPVPNPTFLQFARLPDKIKSKIWREFYLEPRYYIAELHPKDDEIEGEDYDWDLKSCDGESSGEEPSEDSTSEESTPKESTPKENIPKENIPEENVSKKSTPEDNTSNIGTPQTDALNTNAPKGQPYDEYLSDEYSSEEDEAAEDEGARDGTDVNGAAAAENGVVDHGATGDTTINDLFDELGPDEADDEIDNVEGRDSTDLLIRPSSNSPEPLDEEEEEADKPTHRTVFWTLSRHDAEYPNGYYDSIDTTIDSLSRSVAQSVRPRFWLPAFVKDELEDGEEGPWMPIPPPKDSATEMGESVGINWDIDFVHVKVRFRTCVPESIDWMQKIQNLVIDTKPFIARRPQHVTNTCFWMWTNKATLSNLKSIRQIAAPEYQVPFWHTEWCHYQMRHLLRFAPGTPPHWRNIQSELVSDEFWLPPDNLPRQPQWKQFVRDFFGKFRHVIGSRTWKNYMRVPHASDWDEAKGARVIFDIVKRHPSYFHGILFHPPGKCRHEFIVADL